MIAVGHSTQQQRTVFRQITGAAESFRYDRNGNLTNWVNGSINWVYQWDWADRLTKVTSNGVVVLENWYDANSHRIGKAELIGSATVSYVYLFDRWDIVGISSAGSGLYETYTRGVALAGDIGGLVGIARHPFNTKYYVHNNHRGDITHVRANALTLSTHRYTAFGEIIGTTSSVSRFRFSSKEYERSCGLYYYGYRFYAPQWQRWVNKDPVTEAGGLNLYCFVYNNPIVSADPVGLRREWGGPEFPLDWFDTDCPRNCALELAECGLRGAIVCGLTETKLPAGIGKNVYRLCIGAYAAACRAQIAWCENWNESHGF